MKGLNPNLSDSRQVGLLCKELDLKRMIDGSFSIERINQLNDELKKVRNELYDYEVN